MAANAIYGTSPFIDNNTAPSPNISDEGNGILGKDDFLKILITELKYQDPLSPMDSKESIAQMASFSALEQMQNLNKSFNNVAHTISDQLVPSMMLQQASSMIGREVAYINPDIEEDTPEDEFILTGQVNSLVLAEGRPLFIIGNHKIPLDEIVELGQEFNENQLALAAILAKLDELLQTIKPEENGSGSGNEEGELGA